MSIICCICFEIHLSVQAPFQGAGVVESTVMSQHPQMLSSTERDEIGDNKNLLFLVPFKDLESMGLVRSQKQHIAKKILDVWIFLLFSFI